MYNLRNRKSEGANNKKEYLVLVVKRSMRACLLLLVLCLYRCPMRVLFHVNCPGCGMTRAILCVLKLDFCAAFQYHQLFPLVILTVVYLVYREKMSIGKKKEKIVLGLFLVLFVLRWCIYIA